MDTPTIRSVRIPLLLVALMFMTLAIGSAAGAATVSGCSSQGHISSNGGYAWAYNCDHTWGSAHQTRLYAMCDFSPGVTRTPWVGGTYVDKDFKTSSCQWGVEASGFDHKNS